MASARRSGLRASQASPAKLLDDSRFRALLSDDDWGRLPVAIWRRFSTRLADGGTIVYVAVSSKLINGSPANAISVVPIMPWASK